MIVKELVCMVNNHAPSETNLQITRDAQSKKEFTLSLAPTLRLWAKKHIRKNLKVHRVHIKWKRSMEKTLKLGACICNCVCTWNSFLHHQVLCKCYDYDYRNIHRAMNLLSYLHVKPKPMGCISNLCLVPTYKYMICSSIICNKWWEWLSRT